LLNQIPILDSLRAGAAWCVVLYHFICTTIGLFHNDVLLNTFYYGQFGTHVFFVISGFVIPWSMYQNNYKISSFFKYILKRIIRLEPPYIVSIALILIIASIKSASGYSNGTVEGDILNLKRILLHFGYLINFVPGYKWLNGVYWTLAIEFQYYLIMALVFVLLVSKNGWTRYIAYLLCFVMSYFIRSGNHFPFYAPLFLFGILVFLRMSELIGHVEFWIVFTLCILFNYLYCEKVSCVLGSLTALVILYFHQVKVPVLNALGKVSYSTYLVHPVLGAAVINVLSHRFTLEWQKCLLVILGIIVTLVSSYIMYWVIERPSKKLASSIKLN
jgi:peptidoglycan/LPS O-acetylase OafA/YrhL